MKLEVGLYVRSKNGAIAKIEQIVDNEIHFNIKPIFSDGEQFGYNWLYIKDVVKASYNIIDLIEKNDFVNNRRVTDKIGKYIYLEDEIRVSNKQIKSIVTKEQFEQIQYKVGE